MNELTREFTRTMQPIAALIAYTCNGSYHKDYYLEYRKINNSGLMGAAKPVSKKFVQSLVENFSANETLFPHGEIPEGLLYADTRKEKYLWHRPPCQKFLYFKSNLNIPNGKYCLPGLVWSIERNTLCIFAYKAKRLMQDTQLYSAPFFNVDHKKGIVCMGSASLKPPESLTFSNFIKFWEDKFFLSEFSHITGSNPIKNNLVTVIKNSVNSFDNNELKPINKLFLKNLLK